MVGQALRRIALSIVLGFAAAFHAVHAASPFQSFVDTPTGDSPTQVTVGDIDGDENPDFVLSSSWSRRVSVYLNDGTGRFPPTSGRHVDVRDIPVSCALGSFNADADDLPDLVVVNRTTTQVFVGDGSGGFALCSELPVGVVYGDGAGHAVAVGDFNKDGRGDLAFANGQIWIGHGDGTFTAGSPLTLASEATDVVSADFNGDAMPDLAFAVDLRRVRVFLGAYGGNFLEAQGSPLLLGGFPERLVGGDFDGDDDLDLAATDIYGQRVFILENDGLARFSLAPVSPVGVRASYPRGIAAGDFNGDGLTDLALGSNNSREVSILLATPGMGLIETDDSPLGISVGAPISMVASDLDGDHDLDLAAVDFQGDRIALFPNGSTPSLPVLIDIRPGDDRNIVWLGSHGLLPVAILSTGRFNAATVEPASVRLAGSHVRIAPSGQPLCHLKNANADRLPDLVCSMEIGELRLDTGEANASFRAFTQSGLRLTGQDHVTVFGGACPSCDDGNACTWDECLHTGECTHAGILCNDADRCTEDSCDPGLGCAHSTLSCDDGQNCTLDQCYPDAGCGHTRICDDQNGCTVDLCSATGDCTHVSQSDGTPCSDGDDCTGPDSCESGVCQGGPAVGDGTPCSDENACTSYDSCSNAMCWGGPPVNGDDYNVCTEDSCDPDVGIVHRPIDCDDHNPCTDDPCDPYSGCFHTNNTTLCYDADPNTVNDTCAEGVCRGTPRGHLGKGVMTGGARHHPEEGSAE